MAGDYYQHYKARQISESTGKQYCVLIYNWHSGTLFFIRRFPINQPLFVTRPGYGWLVGWPGGNGLQFGGGHGSRGCGDVPPAMRMEMREREKYFCSTNSVAATSWTENNGHRGTGRDKRIAIQFLTNYLDERL